APSRLRLRACSSWQAPTRNSTAKLRRIVSAWSLERRQTVRLHPRDAVIVDYARTAMGRSKNGCFRNVRADEISAGIIKGLLARNEQLDPAAIDDLLWGCVLQREEQGVNIVRNILLLSALPHTIPAQTINRLCGSSMSALHTATANIRAGLGDVYLI